MKKLLLVSVSVVMLAAPAVAADLRTRPVKAPPVAPPPAFTWTGCYVGAFAGGAFTDSDPTFTDLGNATRPSYSGGVNASNLHGPHSWSDDLGSSFIGGGTLGCNWQPVGTPFVLGVEGEVGYTTQVTTGITAAAIQADLTARINALTIGADSRLWWIVSPKLYKTLSLVQGTGGYLVVNNKIGMVNLAPSDAATTVATLIDAKQIAAELDELRLDSTTSAALQLDDNPTSGSYQLISLWAKTLLGRSHERVPRLCRIPCQ